MQSPQRCRRREQRRRGSCALPSAHRSGAIAVASEGRSRRLAMITKDTLIHNGRQLGTLGGLVIVAAAFGISSPYFLTVSNLMNIAEQTSINAIIAVGMTFVIISAGIDLSVGSIVAISGVVLAGFLRDGYPLPAAMAAGLGTGALCGAVNGLLISYG